MSENPFAGKNYDDLPSLEAIYQTSKNIPLVGLFREAVPLILNKYDQHVHAVGALSPDQDMLENNHDMFHRITVSSAEEVMEKHDMYGQQRDNYALFMEDDFYALKNVNKKNCLYELFYKDVYDAYWKDKNSLHIRRAI